MTALGRRDANAPRLSPEPRAMPLRATAPVLAREGPCGCGGRTDPSLRRRGALSREGVRPCPQRLTSLRPRTRGLAREGRGPSPAGRILLRARVRALPREDMGPREQGRASSPRTGAVVGREGAGLRPQERGPSLSRDAVVPREDRARCCEEPSRTKQGTRSCNRMVPAILPQGGRATGAQFTTSIHTTGGRWNQGPARVGGGHTRAMGDQSMSLSPYVRCHQ